MCGGRTGPKNKFDKKKGNQKNDRARLARALGLLRRALRVLRRVSVLERRMYRRRRQAPRGLRRVHVREPRVQLRHADRGPRALRAVVRPVVRPVVRAGARRNTHDPRRADEADEADDADGADDADEADEDGPHRWRGTRRGRARAIGADWPYWSDWPDWTDWPRRGPNIRNTTQPGRIPARDGLRRRVRRDRGGRVAFGIRAFAQSVCVRAIEPVRVTRSRDLT